MGFVTYDIAFLVLFLLFVIIFLYTRKKNLQRQGILYLYRTKWGINFIDKFSKKYAGILRPLQYLVIASGYFLMATIMWLIILSTYIYIKTPIARFIKAPPVFPLIPYFPKLFDLEAFFPPLYFTYFIFALAIVAIVHEFSHGIFARLNNFKIHATGFAFLGPFLGAFVEPDEKQMAKAKKFPQMSVLAAGTFANVVMAVLFFIIMALFFTSLFMSAGVKYNILAVAPVDISTIEVIGNSSIEGYVEIMALPSNDIPAGYLEMSPDEQNSFVVKYFIEPEGLELALETGEGSIFAFEDSPAFNAQIPKQGAITKIDGEKIENYERFVEILGKHSPGEIVDIRIATLNPGEGTVAEERSFEIELGERQERAFLGVAFLPNTRDGAVGYLIENTYNKIKEPNIHYESKIGDFGWFVFNLLWWILVINLLVALFNMLPLGILDGGRFFYLTVWAITGRENWGKKAYVWATWFLLLLLLSMMVKWVFRFF